MVLRVVQYFLDNFINLGKSDRDRSRKSIQVSKLEFFFTKLEIEFHLTIQLLNLPRHCMTTSHMDN